LKVSWDVVQLLDEMRHVAGVPFHVNVAWESDGHVDGSTHYSGLAVDGYFAGMALLDQWLWAERFPWQGIGLYPFWRVPGLHLDLGPRAYPGRWWRDAVGTYLPLSRDLMSVLLTLPAPRVV